MEKTNGHHHQAAASFVRLLEIMDELREKCPWDQKQTFASLRPLTLEEVYELSDTLLDEDMKSLPKELGDVLLHIVFYARLGQESGDFTMSQVIDGLCEKLIYRHPHIYGSVVVKDEQEVKRNWEQLKLKEGNRSVLGGVPPSLPSLIKAHRIQEKAAGIGFDFPDRAEVWVKVREEMEEFYRASTPPEGLGHIPATPTVEMEEEFGDLLFSLVNFARFLHINPENALEKTNKKFIRRFGFLEEKAREEGLVLNKSHSSLMEQWWDEAKKQE